MPTCTLKYRIVIVKGIIDITLSVLAYVFHMLTTENLFRATLDPLQCSQYLRMTLIPRAEVLISC